MLIEGDSTQTVRTRGYEAFDAETFIETFAFPLSGLSVRQQIIDTGQPVVVSDVRTDPQWALPAGAAWLRSYVAAPIYLGDEVIGFINVGTRGRLLRPVACGQAAGLWTPSRPGLPECTAV